MVYWKLEVVHHRPRFFNFLGKTLDPRMQAKSATKKGDIGQIIHAMHQEHKNAHRMNNEKKHPIPISRQTIDERVHRSAKMSKRVAS